VILNRRKLCVTYLGVTVDGVWIGFIDHMYTPLRTTSNYSDTANFHSSQIITAPNKPFSSLLCLTSCSLTMASNSGDSSASHAQVLLLQPRVQNSCQFPQSQLTTINSGTFNPILCCQLSRCHLFPVIQLPSQEILSIIVPSLLSLLCRAQLNCQPSTLSVIIS
jgi:hypothetical protein